MFRMVDGLNLLQLIGMRISSWSPAKTMLKSHIFFKQNSNLAGSSSTRCCQLVVPRWESPVDVRSLYTVYMCIAITIVCMQSSWYIYYIYYIYFMPYIISPPNWLIVKSFDWHSLQLQCIGWCMFLSTFRIPFGNRATFEPGVTCLERQPCALHFSKQWWFFVLTFNFLMQTPNWCGSAPLQRAPNTSTLPLRLGSWSVGIWGQTSGWQHAPSAL